MADLTITAANVVKGSGANLNRDGFAGESVTAGQPVYKKSSDQKWWKSQSDGTAAEAEVQGIASHAAAADQPLAVQTGGQMVMGATLTAGQTYYVSNTAGGICPYADLGTGDYVSPVGYAVSTTTLLVQPIATGVVLA